MSTTLRTFALVLAAAGAAVALFGGRTGPAPVIAASEIAGYRSWTRVNPEPVHVPSALAVLCAAQTAVKPASPHDDKFVTVYVNDVGRRAMLTETTPKFPVGSVIVKEKLSTPKSTEPELLTVMVKREAGYDRDNGDWEYVVFDGAGAKVEARGKLENCQACHVGYRETDFVSRRYLPDDVRERLK